MKKGWVATAVSTKERQDVFDQAEVKAGMKKGKLPDQERWVGPSANRRFRIKASRKPAAPRLRAMQ